MRTAVSAAVLIVVLVSGCGSPTESPNSNSSRTGVSVATPAVSASSSTTATPPNQIVGEPFWAEEEITFQFETDRLFGILAWPSGPGPHPAVVLLSGSGGTDGVRADSTAPTFVEHSRRMATAGFAVLRYDPPGVGRSSGGDIIPSLDERVEETHAAIQFLRSLPNIADDRIGLQGWSQGPWVMAMTAVRHPGEVAFLISVVGSGQTVANQQVYGIQAQSQAAGLPEDAVAKAVLFGRLLIDWQLPEPIYHEATIAEARALGDGPWVTFAEVVYEPDADPIERFRAGAETLRSIRDEPWAEALHLDLYIARLESLPAAITPEEMAALQATVAASLLTDPKDFLIEVHIPVLAFFGEEDVNVDTKTSAALFERYLTEADNEDHTIVVIPDVGHDIGLRTPGYWRTLSSWLSDRFAS